ncbi:hypothetical protein Salat_2908900 [Sesamum alatum]|uniref:Uncharacterized protein n=1 Tax=Sesamum alatum TaxID=300844 RepID=A0AAE1XJK5_9LAMI|nr:hypothetical protein Salat_2908900 [Sesamum alatum]
MEERLQLCNSELDFVMKKLAFIKSHLILLNDDTPNYADIYDSVHNTKFNRPVGVGTALFAGCSDDELVKVEMVEQFFNDKPTRLCSEMEDAKPDVFGEKHNSKESNQSGLGSFS